MQSRLSVLLLCDDSSSHAPNVREHIRALRQFSRHEVAVFNPRGLTHSRRLRLEDYDVVVLHYTIFVLSDVYLAPWFREQLAGFGGLKVQFIQDEYRLVDAMTARMSDLGVDVVYSSVPPDAFPDVYGSRLPGVDVLPTLTGYVPAALAGRSRPPLAGRRLDVVYRGRSIPYWLGRLGQDKVRIGREFVDRAASTDLRCDIAWTEAERIYGDAWYSFLGSSRTTLGTESGASIVDFDGTLQERTESYLMANPAATFEEVEREIFAAYEGNAVIEAISPRVFEAAALGTAMVNFAGRYSGVIEPWTHYVPLEKDFSNFDEVVAAIRDDSLLDAMAARAHDDLVASGRYSLGAFVGEIDRELEARAGAGRRRKRAYAARVLDRRLLGLEALRSQERRAELPLVAAVRGRAAKESGRRLIARFPELERLARHAQLENAPAKRERILRDLVRLAAAAAAHTRQLRYFGDPFDVRVELSAEDRRLTLVSTVEPSQDFTEREELKDRVVATIREGHLEEIVWNNSAVGYALTLPSIPLSSLEIGYHVISGAHRFSALTELAQDDPESVVSALEPLFRARPAEPVHELGRRVVFLLMVLRNPGAAVSRATAITQVIFASSELRRLLGAYLASAEARAETPIDLLLRDFLRLALIGRTPTTVELDDDRTRLTYRSEPGASANALTLDADTVAALERIVWDHSALGSSISSSRRPRMTVRLEDGVHEFDALIGVARHFPHLVARALRRAAAR